MSETDLALCMPVFNEEEGISNYLEELMLAFKGVNITIFVTEDHSTDNTLAILSRKAETYKNLEIIQHLNNKGHGISFTDAMEAAIKSNSSMILTFDGDGQVCGEELRKFYNEFSTSSHSYGEGIRTNRSDPWFRRLISLATRLLVYFASGKFTKDGNTPVRIYSLDEARLLWTPLIIEKVNIPNLYVSSFTRLLGLSIFSRHIVWRDRLGESATGAGWGRQKFRMFPSKRLMYFCRDSTISWFSKSPRQLIKHIR